MGEWQKEIAVYYRIYGKGHWCTLPGDGASALVHTLIHSASEKRLQFNLL